MHHIENDELLMRMKTFLNTKVQQKITNVKKVVSEMIDYFHDYYEVEMQKKKLKDVVTVNDRKKEVMKFFSKTNATNLQNILTHECIC